MALAGCSFAPSALSVPAAPREDAGAARRDAGSIADDAAGPEDALVLAEAGAEPSDADGLDAAATPDASTAEDAAPTPDAAPAPDATTAPDAAPRPDAGPRPDAAAPDGGTRPDSGCASFAVSSIPASFGTVDTRVRISTPPLVADLDGDGLDEVAVGSEQDGMVSVIDFDGCSATPSVTTAPLFVTPSGLAFGRSSLGAPIILSTSGNRVDATSYAGPGQAMTTRSSAIPQFSELHALAVHPSADELIAVGALAAGGHGFISIPRLGVGGVPQSLDGEPVGAPAYLPGPAAAPTTAVLSTTRLAVTNPLFDVALRDVSTNEAPSSAPVAVLTVPLASPTAYGVAYTFDDGMNSALRLVIGDSLAVPPLVSTQEVFRSQSAFVSEPIVVRANNGVAWLFAVREDRMTDELVGCALEQHSGRVECRRSVTHGLGASGERLTPLSVYLTGADPDLAVATRGPDAITFVRLDGTRIARVALQGAPAATPGVSTELLPRYGAQGSLMFVPSGTRLELVAWARPANAGSSAALWSQARGDATRSAQR